MLQLQGVSWVKRRAIAMLPTSFIISHITDEAGIEHIDTTRNLPGGLAGSTKKRILDGRECDEEDDVVGPVTRKFSKIPVEEVTDGFSKQDWTQDTIDGGIVLADSCSTPGKNSHTWKLVQVVDHFPSLTCSHTPNQAWGFAIVNGERRYVRRVAFTSSEKEIHARLVFDYRKYSALLVLSHVFSSRVCSWRNLTAQGGCDTFIVQLEFSGDPLFVLLNAGGCGSLATWTSCSSRKGYIRGGYDVKTVSPCALESNRTSAGHLDDDVLRSSEPLPHWHQHVHHRDRTRFLSSTLGGFKWTFAP